MSSGGRRPAPQHATFSFGTGDQERLDALRKRLGHLGHLLNRSEVIRLSLLALSAQDNAAINALIGQLERLRPGREPKDKIARR
jgi:hypothetical protein